MFYRSLSGDIYGIEPRIIQVEADVTDGLPIFQMVGYLSSEVKEARERVRAALKNSSFRYLSKRITVNLSPADLRKQGTSFDLAIAISLLAAFGEIPKQSYETMLFLGELGLDGTILPIRGVLPLLIEAKKLNISQCFIPKANAWEGKSVQGIQVFSANSLCEVVDHIRKVKELEPEEYTASSKENEIIYDEDFSDVNGQEDAKEAIEIAVGGMHNLLLIGPPGTGKSMLAKRIQGILPPMTQQERLEITKIQSICGLMGDKQALATKRPFRSPHHSIPPHALMGGGTNVFPGEMTLAAGGVLFLDELAEFKPEVLDLMRQPMEDKEITISRLRGTYRFPTNFMLVAAMNPCKCGFYPDTDRCRCTPMQVNHYLSKISEPLLDRMDMSVETYEPSTIEFSHQNKGRTTKMMKERIAQMQERQSFRYQNETFDFNAQIPLKSLEKYCFLGTSEKKTLQEMVDRSPMSMRGVHSMLRTARTIADFEQHEEIKGDDLSKAFYFRKIEKKYWGNQNG